MCTLSILPAEGRYTAIMNRDENPLRAARSGELKTGSAGVVIWAYPLDSASGGTWIGVNSHGLMLALLNEYPVLADPEPAPRSRGALILEALGSESVENAVQAIRVQDPGKYGACIIAAVGRTGGIAVLRSDRRSWESRVHPRLPLLLASSGVNANEARRIREAQFKVAFPGGVEAVRVMHRSHQPSKGPYSVCMHREGSRSVSLTEVSVGHGGGELLYWPIPPCEQDDASPLRAQLPPDGSAGHG